MLNRSQAIAHLSLALLTAVIFACLQFKQLFSHCATISCVAGSGVYAYIWLNTLCLISGMQMWKYAYPEDNIPSNEFFIHEFNPKHIIRGNREQRCRWFKVFILILVVFGMVGLGIFPSSKDNIYTPASMTILAAGNTSHTCLNMECSSFHPTQGLCDTLTCITNVKHLTCEYSTYHECTCTTYSLASASNYPAFGCTSFNCTRANITQIPCVERAGNASWLASTSATIHMTFASIFFAGGIIVLSLRMWSHGCKLKGKLLDFILYVCAIVFGSAMIVLVLSSHKRLMPFYCIESTDGICTNVPPQVVWWNFFGAACEATFVMLMYISCFPPRKQKSDSLTDKEVVPMMNVELFNNNIE